ncbi:lipoate--protein ligase family protein [Paeniglutamicibacter sp. ABSL32-1]|uniref:lipoate--protein ligase family protein n=1 Tax=Paeniglutamicibacter quisquiliarum TaxID=2849498 RepID=UPI001C2DBFA6|nr:biotin/lipoate A/B protein ligase family protein [Paeniglutamicibacter quisquiliarum]MBV1778584.1 lipoate--protein ligase family protein [Paeniglutamicibacter quisquiliarum]
MTQGYTHHGEYKVVGGKLVVADLLVQDGAITAASINGDFFLEPDEALYDLNDALVGLPATVEHSAVRDAVNAGLREGAVMFGFDADAVARVVRRALGHATTWADHAWEVLGPDTMPIVENVALDEVLARQVAAGTRGPTLRLWDWNDSAVIIGSFQSVQNEVDAQSAAEHGIQVVRRISGGGAMFMEAGNCITYSLYLPSSLVDGMSFADSYPFLDAWVMEALASIGVKAHYKPLNDIATEAGKIGGAAQKRLAGGVVLHHVTMSYDIDAEKMLQVLRIGREKISDKGIASAVKRVDPLKSQAKMGRAEIISAMIDTFTRRYAATAGTVDEATRQTARELAATKFSTPEWTARVP